MAKLWDKGFEPDEMIERFTVGDDRQLDMRLARYDVEGSMAHIRMLEHIGLLTADELKTLLAGLEQIRSEIEEGRFKIEEGTEDVHSQVELLLTRRLGEVGKKIHAGRSRNDQVLVDLKLFLRDELRQTAHRVRTLFDRLQELSERYRDVLMPGYTHLQVAMPSSFGLWFGAYAETLVDDMRLLAAAYDVANQNPLGSAAGYGSSFPLDRTMTTRLLGFADLNYNVVAAQMSRGKSERAAAAAVAAVAAGPMSSAAAAAALTQPGTPALAAALRGRHRLGGAKLQPALAALRAGGTRVIPAVPAAVLGGACRGFACSALGGYGAVLPVCRVLAQGLHKGIVPLRLRHSRLLHRRCVVLGVFAVLSVFAPKGTEESHCVLLSHSSVFVRSHKISPPEQPQLEFSVRNLKISWFLRALPARFAPQKAAFFSPFRFSFCAECVIMVPAL